MIPLATDSITITRIPYVANFDPYESDAPSGVVIATDVRAVISTPSANSKLSGGDRVVYTAMLRCDPVDLQTADIVTNAVDGNVWTVMWAKPQSGLGVTFVLASLRLVTGAT